MMEEQRLCLTPTGFIESGAPEIARLAGSLARADARGTSIALFEWVRDHIRYDPRSAMDGPGGYRATAVLARAYGFCIQKAVLLAAMARAAGIPSRLGFADVRNHRSPVWLRELMGTDVFIFHGYVELSLGGRWVKATPAFDAESSRRAGVLPVELDGDNDAMLHPVDPAGHPYIEYLRYRGVYTDLPFDEILRAFRETYPGLRPSRE